MNKVIELKQNECTGVRMKCKCRCVEAMSLTCTNKFSGESVSVILIYICCSRTQTLFLETKNCFKTRPVGNCQTAWHTAILL